MPHSRFLQRGRLAELEGACNSSNARNRRRQGEIDSLQVSDVAAVVKPSIHPTKGLEFGEFHFRKQRTPSAQAVGTDCTPGSRTACETRSELLLGHDRMSPSKKSGSDRYFWEHAGKRPSLGGWVIWVISNVPDTGWLSTELWGRNHHYGWCDMGLCGHLGFDLVPFYSQRPLRERQIPSCSESGARQVAGRLARSEKCPASR